MSNYWIEKCDRYKQALWVIRDLSGAGMSYHDIVIEMREIAKWALDPNHKPLLIGCGKTTHRSLLKNRNQDKGEQG